MRSVLVPFLDPDAAGAEEHWRPHLEADRTWVATDAGRAVGNCCVFSRDVTLPAGPDGVCPVSAFAAISGVGVHPTHRRQGLLRTMMDTMLADAMSRGEALAGLTASESSIYGRFGFGPATTAASYSIDTRESRFAVPAPRTQLRLLDAAEAAKVVPELFERARRTRAGQVDRNEATWADVWADRPEHRHGASANFYVASDEGFASYRAREIGEGGLEYAEIEVGALVGTTAAAEAALWRYLLDLDLARRVVARRRPVDEALRHRLADPRQLRTTSVTDFLWLRVLDVPQALGARAYRHEGRLVLDVRPAEVTPAGGADPAAGVWLLEAGPEGVACRAARAGEEADVRLGAAELASLYLGGVAASLLASAGRVEELRAGALDRTDAVFATTPAPFSTTGF